MLDISRLSWTKLLSLILFYWPSFDPDTTLYVSCQNRVRMTTYEPAGYPKSLSSIPYYYQCLITIVRACGEIPFYRIYIVFLDFDLSFNCKMT